MAASGHWRSPVGTPVCFGVGARRRLREQLDEPPKLTAERQQVEKQIAAADEVLADAEQTHAEVTGPLHARLAETRRACRSTLRWARPVRVAHSPCALGSISPVRVTAAGLTAARCTT